MNFSHCIEKLKIGKRFVLLDIEVRPDDKKHWESAGPENKFLTLDVWKLIYSKLQDVCRNYFSDAISIHTPRFILDKEYQHRLEARPNILMKFEFRNSNQRDVLNYIFNESETRLHKDCLHLEIVDDVREMFRELEERKKTAERLQKENERLRNFPDSSQSQDQEYKPTPLAKSSSSSLDAGSHMEYVPTAINGVSPISQSSYKASKIVDSAKPELDPYTPSSSQDSEGQKICYVPNSFLTPTKLESDREATSVESRIGGKRRLKRSEIFGHSDDEEEMKESDSAKKRKALSEDENNRSVENIFAQDSPPNPGGSTADSEEPVSYENKRAHLSRKTKANAVSEVARSHPDCDASSGKAASSKTSRAKTTDENKQKSSKHTSISLNKSGKLDDWLTKQDRKEASTSSRSTKRKKGTDKDKSKKTPKKEATVSSCMGYDLEKIRAENEQIRQMKKKLDELRKVLPEDKSHLDVPIWHILEMSTAEVLGTFDEYREELESIFYRYKDLGERHWQSNKDITYYTEVTSVLAEDQTYAMLQHVEQYFVPEHERPKYTEFFTSVLIMEWGLRIWMKVYKFTDRQAALDRIKLQEDANPMELTDSYLAPLMGTCKKRR